MAKQMATNGRVQIREKNVPQAMASRAAVHHKPRNSGIREKPDEPNILKAVKRRNKYIATVASAATTNLLMSTCRAETGMMRRNSKVPSSFSTANAAPAQPRANMTGAAKTNV